MSRQNSNSRLSLRTDLDVVLATIGLLACLLLLSLRLMAQAALLVVIPVAGGTAFGLYLLTRRNQATSIAVPTLPSWIAGYLPSLVFLGLAAYIGAISHFGGRTLGVHLLAGGIGTCLLFQILLVDRPPLGNTLILAQILLAAVLIRVTAVLGQPGFAGVDIWTHLPDYTQGIVDYGSLSAIAGYKYVMAPIYHLNTAVGTLVFDSYTLGAFLTLGVVVPLSAIMVYASARIFLPTRWSLLATALFAFSDQFIRWGIHLIPTSLGLAFFLGGLYCLTKLFYRPDPRLLLLVFVTTLATVFTHQVSTTVVLLVLGLATVIGSLVVVFGLTRAGSTLRSTGTLALVFLSSTAITVLSWANTPFTHGEPFLFQMLDVLEETVAGEAGFLNLAGEGEEQPVDAAPALEQEGFVTELVPFIEWFGFALLLSIAVIGGIVLLRTLRPADLSLTYITITGVMFVIIYGFSLFGIRTLMPGRWLAFLHAPMAIMGAVGVYYLSRHASRNVILVCILVLALGYPMTMVVAEKATLDNPAFDDEYPRFAYTEAELSAVDTISEIRPPTVQEELETDHPYRTLFGRLGGYDTLDLRLNEGVPVSDSAVVARQYQHEGATAVFTATEPPVSRPSNRFITESVCPDARQHVYTNDEVTLCTVANPGGEVTA